MTQFLSSVLGAEEPTFSHSVRRLEQVAGAPSHDIRLSSEIKQILLAKLSVLGLDPKDTTGPELYHALMERLAADESAVRGALHLEANATSDIILTSIQKFLQVYDMPKNCFALKTSVAKRLLKKKPPRTVMKRLGYRSLDSLLKNEAVAHIYAAAALVESPNWNESFRQQYRKLTAGDFEARALQFSIPKAKRWSGISQEFVGTTKQPIVSFPELGAIVFLSVETSLDGLAITALLLGLHQANLIRAYSSFLKLQQVQPDFGILVQQTCNQEPQTGAQLAGQPVPWRLVHRYYSQTPGVNHPEAFEPHVQPEDMSWHHGEDLLAKLAPNLDFWQGTQFLAVLHEGEPVSLNVLDAALSYCNHLPFTDRVVHFMRDNLWHELMMRYLHQENLESAVQQQIGTSSTQDEPLAFAE